MSDMSLERMLQEKKASCPVCSELNEYGHLNYNDWTNCKKCGTPMVLAKIDNIIFFLRHGWT